MGCGASADSLFVDDDPKLQALGIGFSREIFKEKEWRALKSFCNKLDIHQQHLNIVFKKYLVNDEVYLREFRVKTLDSRNMFISQPILMQVNSCSSKNDLKNETRK